MSGPALRRVMHAASGTVVLVALAVDWSPLRLVLTAMASGAVLFEWLRIRNPRFNAIIEKAVPVFRARERRRPSGAFWLIVGYALAAWAPVPGPSAGILVGALADPAASLIGSRWGGGKAKSLVGTTAVIAVSMGVLGMLGMPWLVVLPASLAAGGLERWAGSVDDNLLVAPGVSAIVGFLS